MPFNWGYFDDSIENPTPEDVVNTPADKGEYVLRAWPLEDNPEVLATDADGKVYSLDLDPDATTAIKDPNGNSVVVKVRDVTDDDNAESLATATFRPVYDSAHEADDSLVETLAIEGSASDGAFDKNGTVKGDCESSDEPHAHVPEGTTFNKNGIENMPVNSGAKINLLWDELLSGVLGTEERKDALHEKALNAATGAGVFDSGDTVEYELKYMDLVDMEDGNLWVGTAKGEKTTVFWPYPEDVNADDKIAVVRFPGLTRDYTIDADEGELAAAVAGCNPDSLRVTKTDDGVLFDVPSCGFGPFELMWAPGDSDDQPSDDDKPGDGDDDDTPDDQPGDDDDDPSDDQNPDDDPSDTPGDDNVPDDNPDDDTTDDTPGDDVTDDDTPEEPGDGISDTPDDDRLAQTGDASLLTAGGTALVAIVTLAGGITLKRRRN